MDAETALIVACPAADAVMGDQRNRLDRSAQAGVPAHLTVSYPFKADVGFEDHRKLTKLFGQFHGFAVSGERTGWFGRAVVFVEPHDPGPVIALTRAVQEAFPAYPIYGGAFEEVVPHLTIGHEHSFEVLRTAERVVVARLPFQQIVDHVELWSGPPLASAPEATWRHVRDYPLGPPS